MPPKFLSRRELCPVLSSRPSPMSVYWLATSVFLFSLAIIESIFLSRVEGRGFHVEGEGAMSRVEGKNFFSKIFFLEKVIIEAINDIKTNKKNSKSKWRVNIF